MSVLLNKPIRIAHLTSVHPRWDTRIFVKECTSLSAAGYEVLLIVADGLGDEVKNNVSIIDIGKAPSRLKRMVTAWRQIYKKAREVNAVIYHIHDPELIPAGMKLIRDGRKVIFDAHEDVPKQILSKSYIPRWMRKSLSFLFAVFERRTLFRYTMIVTATLAISKRYLQLHSNVVVINNYPLPGELYSGIDYNKRPEEIAYVGGMSEVRGLAQVIKALELTQTRAKLNLVGAFSSVPFADRVRRLSGMKNVKELGTLNRSEVSEVLSRSRAGLVTFLPEPNHFEAQPNKLFEYMSAEVPVIASNFPLWKEIVEGCVCGVCVDPLSPTEIASAIDWIILNPSEAQKMGERGRNAIIEKYNWEQEFEKLGKLYKQILA